MIMNEFNVKNAVRNRDGRKCVDCGMTEKEHRKKTGRTLDVHRLVPDSVYAVDGCIALCMVCHKARHGQEFSFDDFQKSTKRKVSVWKLRIPDNIKKLLQQSAQKNSREVSQEASFALENYLRSIGMWPPS